MPLRKAIFFLLLFGIVTSCWWGGPLPPKHPAQPEIYYYNAQGLDLLDLATPHHLDSVMISWINHDGKPGTVRGNIYKEWSSVPYLPDGYILSIDPITITDDNGNNGIIDNNTCTVFIRVTKTDTDTVAFTYSGNNLKSFYYNNTLITPPAGLTAYPAFLSGDHYEVRGDFLSC